VGWGEVVRVDVRAQTSATVDGCVTRQPKIGIVSKEPRRLPHQPDWPPASNCLRSSTVLLLSLADRVDAIRQVSDVAMGDAIAR
jgi:hypothetical protein